MFKVKVYGAGSIGNHLSNAARRLGWSVDLCDQDPAALVRTKNDIYPTRYGQWDEAIGLYTADQVPSGGYDMIFVGTPPDSHMKLAIAAVKEKPRCVLVEKPICTPDLAGAQELYDLANELGVAVFCGYDHVVGQASVLASDAAKAASLGPIETLDVEFREHWGGIFAAHPWLNGPQDTYLGFWQRGGGAAGEHSHATNLWQHFAHEVGAGRVTEVSAALEYVNDGVVDYDKLALFQLRTENGLMGRVVQDVVTAPPRKWARVQGRDGFVEWQCGWKPGTDAVFTGDKSGVKNEQTVQKTRPDDFIAELRHIEAALASGPSKSGISLARGLDTMMVVAAAHKSAREKRTVTIDYSKGYRLEALI